MGTLTVAADKPEPVPAKPTLLRGLSLLDSILLLIGGIIGGAVFLTPADVVRAVPHAGIVMFIWVAGGLISLLACFAFAELGAMYPEAGGQYVYLRHAYGDLVAFLYGWIMFTAGNSGGIATISVSVAQFVGAAFPALEVNAVVHGFHILGAVWTLTRAHLIAVGAIAVLTWVNILGLRRAADLQNAATFLKFAAVAIFIVLGFAIGHGSWSHFSSAASGGLAPILAGGSWSLISAVGLAFIAVFWTYDGWVYIAWSAGEIRDPQRNIPRSLIWGMVTVIVVYVALNAVYIYALPLGVLGRQQTVAEAAAVSLFSGRAAVWLSLLIAVSAFGACCSNILSGARISYAMGKDGLFFRSMAYVHPRWRTPVVALLAQGVWASVIALSGRYDQLFTYTVFMMVISYVSTVVALFVLRRRHPDQPRPYRCAGYPWVPAIYVVLASLWAMNAIFQSPKETLVGLGLAALGIPGYIYWKRTAGK